MRLFMSMSWRRSNLLSRNYQSYRRFQLYSTTGITHEYSENKTVKAESYGIPRQQTGGSPKKKFSETVLLPKTNFPLKINPIDRKDHEERLAIKLKFDDLYLGQRHWQSTKPEFILHDGPPYANGEVHIGHAVNKILKDITNRYKLLRGYRINYRPGWDCHGLPIELKSSKEIETGPSPVPQVIRNSARKVASESIEKQMAAFKRWGIMADWENPYKSFDKDYIKAQLQFFVELNEKGFLYREMKPVYWSPSSHTALAESELEYVHNHESTSVYLGVDLNLPVKELASKIDVVIPPEFLHCGKSKVQAVIWTTTAWSLPSNNAVAYREDEKYSLGFFRTSYPENRIFYIVASKLIPQFEISLNRGLKVLAEFSASHLSKLSYQHPWFENQIHSFLPSDFVTMDKGTGLVHVAPAHGSDDYLLALKHNLPIECYIDDQGNFDNRIESLKGLPALTGGNMVVLNKLKQNLLHKDKFIHSYPYDWRTKKPVIIKASMQWFINTQKLKDKAIEALSEVNIYPKNVQNALSAQVLNRPYWCISRQRVWGVPIPVIYRKDTGEPVIDSRLISRLEEMLDTKGNLDDWWSLPLSDLLNDATANEIYDKGKDIFDIWVDSGISWHLLDGKVADLYLEGVDQFTGWFQSSLLLSLALRGSAPYKNLFVHGFVVDEDNKKMSKSLGNVVNPATITDGDSVAKPVRPAFGADVLRWWVATQGCEGGNTSVSINLLRSAEENISKLRQVLRFLVGVMNEEVAEELDIDDVTYDELEYMDQYMLTLLAKFQNEITECYDSYEFHKAMMKAVQFATVSVSAQYFTWVKDRLYCDFKHSQSRKTAIYTLNHIYFTLLKTLAPVLPFLAEESYLHYSSVAESLFKYSWFDAGDVDWNNTFVKEYFDLALDVRTSLNQIVGENDQRQVWVEIICNQKNYQLLLILHADQCNSELCDILQVSGVSLKANDQAIFTMNPYGVSHSLQGFSIGVSQTEKMQCARCRRYCCDEGDVLCPRCAGIVNPTTSKPMVLRDEAKAKKQNPETLRGTRVQDC